MTEPTDNNADLGFVVTTSHTVCPLLCLGYLKIMMLKTKCMSDDGYSHAEF